MATHMNMEDLNSLHRKAVELNQRPHDATCVDHAHQLTYRPRHQRDEIPKRRATPTTLDEYLTACHELIFSGFSVETDTRELSLGYADMPQDKPCPKLKPWVDFTNQQRLTFGKLYDALGSETRVFENRDVMERLWKGRSPRKPIGDETFFRFFMRDSLEKPVAAIISELAKIEKVREAFNIGDGVDFEDGQDFVIDAFGVAYDKRVPSPCTPDSYVDQKDGAPSVQQELVCIVDGRLPHMLTAPRLCAGLREMDVYAEVANRSSMLPACRDSTARFQYHAEKLTACALTDAYGQMIEEGLEYGLVTTGEATVFLKSNWDEPGILYYHLAEFGPDVSAHPSDAPIYTAVGQHLAFILMLLGQQGRPSLEERRKATVGLRAWKADFVDIWRSIPESERWASPEDCPKSAIDRSQKSSESEEIDETLPSKDENLELSEDESISSWQDLGDWRDLYSDA